ncbi:MAG: dTDP-4-dehydrorhamnose 3,5-epimerase family protein [Elusimicrobia bacterium]|nr:dTDP-4-dehydrorhamnose 3,5-epimerase family protein [Elusimicrobiota bacterium]
MIKNVLLKELTIHKDERGALFEILRSDWPDFKKFGQAYITVCKTGWVKGWHYHKIQTDNFCVVKGKARIVLIDSKKKEFMEFELSEKKPALLTIPPKVIHGFECISKGESWIMNIPTEIYRYKKPDEYRIQLDDPTIPYNPWKKKKGW